MKSSIKKTVLAACMAMASLLASAQQTISVKGQVTDTDGLSLPGAFVTVEGTTDGTVTDADGRFEIRAASGAVLKASFMGYRDASVPVGGRSVVDIVLTPDDLYLEDVVVVGYGVQKKVNVTGSVAMVNYAEEALSRPVTSTAQVLQGMNAGLMVSQSSGKPGDEGITIRVRGIGTLNSSAPLVIVDGFETGLSSVSPDDIESVSVLKDAASCAIYGNRGANGVILVTTKSGSSKGGDRHSVSYSGMFAINTPASHFNVVSNYADHMSMMNESAENVDANAPFSQAMIELWREKEKDPNGISESGYPNYVAYPNTDWFRKGLYQMGVYQKHSLTASGASKSISYLASASYMDNPGVISNTAVKKYQMRANVTARPTKWLEVGTKIWGYVSKRDITDLDGTSKYMSRRTIPCFYPYYDGKYGWAENPEQSSNSGNALYFIDRYKGYAKGRYQNATAFANIIFPLDIKWSNSFNYVHSQAERKYNVNLQNGYSFSRDEVGYTYRDNLSKTKGYIAYEDACRWTFQSSLNWARTVARKHDITALLGFEMQYYNNNKTSGSKSNYTNFVLTELGSASKIETLTGSQTDYSSESVFGRVTYAYDGRYMVEANLRVDGSSRFAARSRWGVFPSVSAAWRISKESFMKGASSWLSNLKIRASIGQLGNNSIGNYDWQATYSDSGEYCFGPNDTVSSGLVATLSNSSLRWETTTSYNIGLDFAALKNRLTFETDVYDRVTDGILYKAPILATVGNKTAPYQNLCQVTNKGVELTIGWKDDISDFHYGIGANFTRNWNRVTRYNGRLQAGWTEDSDGHRHYSSNIGDVSTEGTCTRVMEGKLINEFYLLNTYSGDGSHFFPDGSVNPAGGPSDGMIRTPEDMRWIEAMIEAGNSFLPNRTVGKKGLWYGEYIYADVNGDGIYGNEHDYTFQGCSATPKFYYGLQLDLGWKGFGLSASFAGAGGNSFYWYLGGFNSFATRSDLAISEKIGYDHYFYDPANPSDPRTNLKSKNARLTLNLGSEQTVSKSTIWLYRADYLRLKNLNFGYTFPKKWMERVKVSELRVFFSGENLFTLTSYPGMDPESSDSMNFYANLRQYSFGINLKF